MEQIDSVVVIGAGATGGYLAARLAEAQVDVTLVARGASFDQISAHGIELRDAAGKRSIPVGNVIQPGDACSPADLAILCVKAYDTKSAIELVDPILSSNGRVLCLQNGVKNEQLLAEALGPQRVLTGVLYIGSERIQPGVIECSSPPRILVGPLTGQERGPSERVCQMLNGAQLEAEVKMDINQAKWQKFLFNCALNPLTAVTQQKLAAILALPPTARVFHDLALEAAAVALAADAPLAPSHMEQLYETAHRMNISSSMAEDLAAGRPLESDAFTGHVIALGQRYSIPTPVTIALHGILVALDSTQNTDETSS